MWTKTIISVTIWAWSLDYWISIWRFQLYFSEVFSAAKPWFSFKSTGKPVLSSLKIYAYKFYPCKFVPLLGKLNDSRRIHTYVQFVNIFRESCCCYQQKASMCAVLIYYFCFYPNLKYLSRIQFGYINWI